MNVFEQATSFLLFEKNYSKAIQLFNEILKKYPNHKESLIYTGMAFEGIKNSTMAKKFYSMAQYNTPADLSFIIKLSNRKIKTSDFEDDDSIIDPEFDELE